MPSRLITLCLLLAAFVLLPAIAFAADPIERIELLPPSPENPRNSEGDFIQLKDGRLLFIYSHYTGGSDDDSTAHLASRESTDGGATWSEESKTVIENHAKDNIMSVSLLRLPDGSIAMFYLAKESWTDCRPVVRFSKDEARTWSEPVMVIPDSDVDYYVLNNDRVIELKSGRLLLAVAQHTPINGRFNGNGKMVCYYSDDHGQTWTRSETTPDPTPLNGKPVVLQEPGLVELKDGRVMMFVRTNGGSQYLSYSADHGETWTQLEPSELISPVSPATIERLPQTGDLVCVYNNHADITKELAGKRTPLSVALSKDDGDNWTIIGDLYTNPNGWYCYTAMDVVDDHIVLGHCAGDRTKNNGLAQTNITRVPVSWIYNTNN
ncbi:MAG: sialidase [Planctomyces sp.]|nr:sialidase [Planctomyces sp.]